jgi:hypothetical protein
MYSNKQERFLKVNMPYMEAMAVFTGRRTVPCSTFSHKEPKTARRRNEHKACIDSPS